MELLRKLLRSLARQAKDVKETSMESNLPEAAVIREPTKEYIEEEEAAERRIEEDDEEDNRDNRVHYKNLKNHYIFKSLFGFSFNL